MVLVCVFFFQAEDGIRDVAVTGVQTCALPISNCTWASGRHDTGNTTRPSASPCAPPGSCSCARTGATSMSDKRSEERRVGKSVDLGGRRIIKKKKKRKHETEKTKEQKTHIRLE